MNNDTPRDITAMTPLERRAFFSAATPTINMIPELSTRRPPRPRRNSVRHRAIR